VNIDVKDGISVCVRRLSLNFISRGIQPF